MAAEYCLAEERLNGEAPKVLAIQLQPHPAAL